MRARLPHGLFSQATTQVIVFLLLANTSYTRTITYLRIDRPTLEKYLRKAPAEADRPKTLKILFRHAGCDPDKIREQPVTGEVVPNVTCVLPGTQPEGTRRTIVIGAALSDHNLNQSESSSWVTPMMLRLLAESVGSVPHQNDVVFVAFAGSDEGKTGFSWYLDHLTAKERKNISAMVFLKSIGIGFPSCSVAKADANRLADYVTTAARTLQLPSPPALPQDEFQVHELDHWRIPGVVFNSLLTEAMIDYSLDGEPHLKALDASVQLQRVDQSYNLLCVYLLYLDDLFGPKHRKGIDAFGPEIQLDV